MQPVTLTARFFQDNESQPVVDNLFPLLQIKDLMTFSGANKTCLNFWRMYYTNNKNYFDRVINRMVLKAEAVRYKCFVEIQAPEIKKEKNSIKRSACQSSISENSIFIYRTVLKHKKEPHFSSVIIEHYTVKDWKLAQVIKIPVFGKADQVEKLVAIGKKLYLACVNYFSPKPELMENYIFIVDLEKPIDKKKNAYFTKEIVLSSYPKILEVFQDAIITGRGFGSLEFYDRHSGDFLHSEDVQGAKEENRVMATRIAKQIKFDTVNDNEVLYVRLAQGLLHMYDTKSKEIIGSIHGPSCNYRQEHFEVVDGQYLYTQAGVEVRRWSFIKVGDKIETNELNKIQVSEYRPGPYTFHLDQGILYLGYPLGEAEAYDSETFECLIPYCRSIWRKKVIVKDGIQLFIRNTGEFGNYPQGIFVRNLNDIKKNYRLPEPAKGNIQPKKRKWNPFLSHR